VLAEPEALADAPTAVALAEEPAARPTAVELTPVAVEFAPHSVEPFEAPLLHCGELSASAGLESKIASNTQVALLLSKLFI
jgi:hypothetical protein